MAYSAKKKSNPASVSSRKVEGLTLGAAAPLEYAQAAAQNEAGQRHDGAHGGLRIALGDVVGEQREVAGHGGGEHASQGGKADDVHGSCGKGREQEHGLNGGEWRFILHELDLVAFGETNPDRCKIGAWGPR
jgi:hypothetical protein